MSISVGRDHFEYTAVYGKQRHVEGSTAEVKHEDVLLSFLLVQTVGNGSGSPDMRQTFSLTL